VNTVVDDQLAATAAHQLGQGVVLLLAYTDMVRDAGTAPPSAVKGLEDVSRRLRCLDDALLDLARIGRERDAPVASDPTEALASARRLLADDHSTVVVDMPRDPLPRVLAGPGHLERLFLHALRRAVHSGQRRLNVAAARHDGLAYFRIGDERAARDLVHSPSPERCSRPVSDVGLEVCRRIVRMYEGELWLDDDGRSLSFTLPAAPS
jgi:signal transduction histidine kinase